MKSNRFSTLITAMFGAFGPAEGVPVTRNTIIADDTPTPKIVAKSSYGQSQRKKKINKRKGSHK